MEKLGIITKTDGKMAEIKITRDSACGENCAACGLCKNREMTLTVPCSIPLSVGDTVRLLSDDKTFLKGSALGYLSLTALLILGGVIGTILGSDLLAFGLGIGFLAAGIFCLKKLNPKSLEIKLEKLPR